MMFEEVYSTYFQDVYCYVRRLSGDEHIAEEITSETFFKALKAIDRFRGECDLRIWLCQIAKNCYFSYVKKNGRLSSLEEMRQQEPIDPDASLEEYCSNREHIRQIQAVLHTLPDPYKEVFMWRVFAQLSFQQIGDLFQKSGNWACVTYHRARKQLKSKLEEMNYE